MRIIGLTCIGISGFMIGTFVGCLLTSDTTIQTVLAGLGLATSITAMHLGFRFYKLVSA
jgi:hypothetical protein